MTGLSGDDLREKNMTAFENRYGVRPCINLDEDNNYKIDFTPDGQAVLYALNNGVSFRLNSSYDPLYEARRWSRRLELINRRTVIAVLGLSTGVFVRAMLELLRPDTSYFVYEPDEGLFSFICKYVDISDLIEDKRINLFVTEKQHKQMAQALIWEMSTYNPETIGVNTPFYSNNKEFDDICQSMRVYAAVNRNYQKIQGRRSMECRMYAWNHMWESMTVKDLEEKLPKDIPAVIVSAGPSLLKNVSELKNLKNHALIVCTDRALSVLDSMGIEPDLVSSVDSDKNPVYLETKNIDSGYLLCSYQLDIGAQKMFPNRKIFYYGLNNEMELLGDKCDNGYGFDHGGNVAGSTFTILRRMGVKKFVLIGQDLAYLDGRHHADESEDGKPEKEVQLIEGIDGKPVESCNTWINFRNFFERQISIYPEIEVIDATEGGALIKGSRIMKLSNVSDMFKDKEYDIKGMITGLVPAQTRDEYEKSVRVMEKWCVDLDRISELSKELEDIFLRLVDIFKQNQTENRTMISLLDQMNNIRNHIYNLGINNTLERYWVEDVYSIPDRNIVLRNKEEAMQTFDLSINYYRNLPDNCKSLKEKIKKAIEDGRRDFEVFLNNHEG